MLKGTKWFTTSRLAWGLATVLVVVAGTVVAAAAAPAVVNGKADTFFVDVIGPGFAQPGNECLFRAVPKPPAVSPFTYQWKAPASGTDRFRARDYAVWEESVLVEVDVWDSDDQHGTGQITIQLDGSNEPCGI